MLRKASSLVLAAVAAVLLTSCMGEPNAAGGAPNAATGKLGGTAHGKKVTFIVYADQSTPFFNPVVNGARAAAKVYGINLNVEYSNSNTSTQVNQIETATASGVSGLAVSIPSNTAYTKSICAAHAKGIPVVAFNVTATAGQVRNCVLSYVGQNFEQAGYQAAKQLVDAGKVPHGAQVFCPVEDPTAVYASGRAAGANRALKAVGAKCDVVSTSFDLAQAQTTETQYLLGHQGTKVILALGQVPLQVAPSATKAAHTHAAIAGFDLSQQIATSIENGSILATIEQQPYLQGYYSVTQLALNLAYGSTPSDVNTGNKIVNSSNVRQIAKLAGTVY
ncbi:MAG: substrate-binding domain-containing protein [Nocardiopsaceae bacterium]|nr:substrate-binding domain-containing protein [Nocardiopsaceae bacterium]